LECGVEAVGDQHTPMTNRNASASIFTVGAPRRSADAAGERHHQRTEATTAAT